MPIKLLEKQKTNRGVRMDDIVFIGAGQVRYESRDLIALATRPKFRDLRSINSHSSTLPTRIIVHPNMSIHIYAEHLINIRTLTVQVSLATTSDGSTILTADGNILTLSHRGETIKATLPVSIAVSERARLSVTPVPSTNFSCRVRLDDTLPRDSQSSETVIPWTATSLSQQVQLQCKACHAEILPRGTVQTWKDLPSEGWAEMMEFWHCHKPDEPHDHEHQTDKKGYSADSKLAIRPSVGLVNATSFVLAADDCKNTKVGHIIFPTYDFETNTMWALKRTGAFRPQGYNKWKIRDIAAL
jgi:hypothetical protein